MKNTLFFIVLLITFKNLAQNNPKIAFQKSRYELGVSCFKNADFKKALDLFSVAYKIKPENDFAKESLIKIDTLKTILRKQFTDGIIGTWKMKGDKPIWIVNADDNNKSEFDELIEISQSQILLYEVNKKTQIKKLIKSEDLVFYNKDASDASFSDIIFSDGTIWSCLLNEDANELHIINIAKKTEAGVEKILSDNLERYYIKVK